VKSNKILIVDDIDEILDLYEVLLEGELDTVIIRATNSAEAIEILNVDSEIDLIVSDMNMPGGNGDLLLKYNLQSKKIPFILSTSNSLDELSLETQSFIKDNDFVSHLRKPSERKEFLDSVNNALENTNIPKSSIQMENTLYRRVQIDFLKMFISENADIYIKIGEDKFVKIVHKNELVEPGQLEKYQLKGEKYAFVSEKDYSPLVENLMSSVNEDIDSSEDMYSLLEAGAEGLKVVNDSLHYLGVSDSQRKYVKKFVNKCLTQLSTNPSVNNLLKRFYKQKGYLVGHSLLTIHIASLIISRSTFSNSQQLEKLSYAGLLHDISIKDPELAKIIDQDESYESLSEKQKDVVRNHATQSAAVVEKINYLSDDVKKIILDHHEKCDGTGFPRGLRGNNISPMSAIFILSLRAAHFMYFQDYPNNKGQLISDLLENYNSGNFKKPLKALVDIMNEN
jgi:response regulator RpfG family c-di-GMP phosphodiesterase